MAGVLMGSAVLIVALRIYWIIFVQQSESERYLVKQSLIYSKISPFALTTANNQISHQQSSARPFEIYAESRYYERDDNPLNLEIVFEPSGTCKDLCVRWADLSIELTYATSKTNVTARHRCWDSKHPIIIELPDRHTTPQTVRITGKYGMIFRFKPNVKEVRVPPETTEEDFRVNVAIEEGYVIDTLFFCD